MGALRGLWARLREWIGESAVLRSGRVYERLLAAIGERGPELAAAGE